MGFRSILPAVLTIWVLACADRGRQDAGLSEADGAPEDTAADAGADAGSTPDAAPDSGSEAGVEPDAGAAPDSGRAPDTGGGPAPVRSCRRGCTVPADCGNGTAAFNEDNYACVAGACEYVDCGSDQDCRDSMGPSAVCRPSSDGIRRCTGGCTTAHDCSAGTADQDDDNYRCEQGGCLYLGCLSDEECRLARAPEPSVCRPAAVPFFETQRPPPINACTRPCTVATSSTACVGPVQAFDADNYVCAAGGCRYIGCRSDAECRDGIVTSPLVCR